MSLYAELNNKAIRYVASPSEQFLKPQKRHTCNKSVRQEPLHMYVPSIGSIHRRKLNRTQPCVAEVWPSSFPKAVYTKSCCTGGTVPFPLFACLLRGSAPWRRRTDRRTQCLQAKRVVVRGPGAPEETRQKGAKMRKMYLS